MDIGKGVWQSHECSEAQGVSEVLHDATAKVPDEIGGSNFQEGLIATTMYHLHQTSILCQPCLGEP